MHPRHESVKPVDCQPVCDCCGGLECLERPRFFCGQLLSDADLNSAQHYVIEKNRLHNRYLIGTGVVCGLGVYCDKCSECRVTVQPGYAIDCCGNDVIVCESTSFDVCAYIDKCLCRRDPCAGGRRPDDCDDQGPREYCLVLSYKESPADPVTPFGCDDGRADGCGCGEKDCGCGGKCGCGGGKGCGCGGRCKQPARRSGRCEPTRLREGFRLDLVRKPKDAKLPGVLHHLTPLAQFQLAWNALPASTPGISFDEANRRFVLRRDFLLEAIDAGPLTHCDLRDRLCKLRFPELRDNWQPAAEAAFAELLAIFRQIERDRVCDLFLIKCPDCDEGGVVLACITVRNRKVVNICNLERTQLLTPRLANDIFQTLTANAKNRLEQFCCAAPRKTLWRIFTALNPNAVMANRPWRVGLIGQVIAAASMAGNWLGSWLSSALSSAGIGEDAGAAGGPPTIHTLELHGQPGDAVSAMLKESGVDARKVPRPDEVAYAAQNLVGIAWELKDGKADVVIDSDGDVAAIRR